MSSRSNRNGAQCPRLATVTTREPGTGSIRSSNSAVRAKWPRWLVANCSSKPSARLPGRRVHDAGVVDEKVDAGGRRRRGRRLRADRSERRQVELLGLDQRLGNGPSDVVDRGRTAVEAPDGQHHGGTVGRELDGPSPGPVRSSRRSRPPPGPSGRGCRPHLHPPSVMSSSRWPSSGVGSEVVVVWVTEAQPPTGEFARDTQWLVRRCLRFTGWRSIESQGPCRSEAQAPHGSGRARPQPRPMGVAPGRPGVAVPTAARPTDRSSATACSPSPAVGATRSTTSCPPAGPATPASATPRSPAGCGGSGSTSARSSSVTWRSGPRTRRRVDDSMSERVGGARGDRTVRRCSGQRSRAGDPLVRPLHR